MDDLALVATELLQVFKFSPEQVNEKAIQQFSILAIEADVHVSAKDAVAADSSEMPADHAQGNMVVDINAATAELAQYPVRIRPDPQRLAASGLGACSFYATKHGCVRGDMCNFHHDVIALQTSVVGNVSCLNCGMIPTKETVAHLGKDCWRHGGGAFNEDRWTGELNERGQGYVLRKYELLKPAVTKGAARHERNQQAKADQNAQKKINALEETITELKSNVQELKGSAAPKPKAPPASDRWADVTDEQEKERRRIQSEQAKFVNLMKKQEGVREQVKKAMVKEGCVKDVGSLSGRPQWKPGTARSGEYVEGVFVKPISTGADLAQPSDTTVSISIVKLSEAPLSLLDSGAEVHADDPTDLDLLTDHPYVTDTKGVHGSPVKYDTTREEVVLIPGLPRPIISEVCACNQTRWRKIWLDENTCVMALFTPIGEKLLKKFVYTHAAECVPLVIEDRQTKMTWEFFERLQADLRLNRSRKGNDEHDRSRTVATAGTEDGVSPGSTAFRHRAAGVTQKSAPPKPLVVRHLLIQTILIGASGYPLECAESTDYRRQVAVNPIGASINPAVHVELCPIRNRDDDDASDEGPELGKRGRKRPRYGPEEWVDVELNEDIEYVFGFSRAVGMGGHGKVATYPYIEFGRVVWFADLTGEKPGFEGIKISFVFRQAKVGSMYSIPVGHKSLGDLTHAVRRWCIQDGSMAIPKTLIMDREKAMVNGYSNSTNQTFLQVCSECLLTIQFTIPDRGCRPAEGGISIADDHARHGMAKSNLHPRHYHRVQQLLVAKREIAAGRIGSMVNVVVSELVPGTLCWCVLTRKQRDAIHCPRGQPRCCLFVIVSFDEHSHFGVYGELITPWKKEIVLTTVSWGQLRVSNVLAYSLQRFGGVFRRVAGYVDGKDVIQLPGRGWDPSDCGNAQHYAMDEDDSDGGGDDSDGDSGDDPADDLPEEQRKDTNIDFDMDDGDESDSDEDEAMDDELGRTVEKICLIPRRSMQYCYRHHREGLYNAKRERALYGAQLDVRVEHVRQHGLNTKHIEVVFGKLNTSKQDAHPSHSATISHFAPIQTNHSEQQYPGGPSPPEDAFIDEIWGSTNDTTRQCTHKDASGRRCLYPIEEGSGCSRCTAHRTTDYHPTDSRPVTLLDENASRSVNQLKAHDRQVMAISRALKTPAKKTGPRAPFFTLQGDDARNLCAFLGSIVGEIPEYQQHFRRLERELNITEGISERVAYNKYGHMPWEEAELDEFNKIIVNLECLEGPYLISEVKARCGPEDTLAFIAYVYARKGIEKCPDGKPKVRCVYVGDRIYNLITGMLTRVLSQSRRPPAAGWEVDLQTAASQMLGLHHTKDADITSAFPAVPMPYYGQRHYVRARGRLLECLCDHFKVGYDEQLCWALKKNLYGFPCAQDNFDAHLAFQLEADGWKLLAAELTHHLWIKTEEQIVDCIGQPKPAIPVVDQAHARVPHSTSNETITQKSLTKVVAMLVKYVDGCRWAGLTPAIVEKTSEYLQLCYGKFRDVSDTIGTMLGKDYVYHPKLDGINTTRLVMQMKSTEEKYVADAIAYFDEALGPYKGALPKTPLAPPGTFSVPGENEVSGESTWNVVSAPQGQHVGRLGWLASKGRPELMESYRMHSSALLHWSEPLNISLRRTFMWLRDHPLDMHQFIDKRDVSLYEESGRSDFPLALLYLRVIMFTDACHEWVSVTGYLIVLQGAWGSRVIVKWRSGTTKLRSTSSTYSELEALHLGVIDFLPIWQAIVVLFGAHVEGVVYIDSESALKIVQAGFSKGLLWLTGVDRCTLTTTNEAIGADGAHVATTKGRTLKIQFLHELIAHHLQHVRSGLMMADALTKQLVAAEFDRHLRWSFQLVPRTDPIRPRCSCMRCEGYIGFAKSRCENFAVAGKDVCEHCDAACLISPRNLQKTIELGILGCKCKCRGKNWGESIKLVNSIKALALTQAVQALPVAQGSSVHNATYGLPCETAVESTWGYSLYWDPEQFVFVAFALSLMMSLALVLYLWLISRQFQARRDTLVRKFYFECSGQNDSDSDMTNWNKVSQGGGGDAKKGRTGGGGGGGGGGDDGDLSELMRRLLRQPDRRPPGQAQKDIDRRLASQCIFHGWFLEDPDTKAQSGLRERYRRCRENASASTAPWCLKHSMKWNDDPDDDPNQKSAKDRNYKSGRNGTRKSKGLGSSGHGVQPSTPGKS
ncbi:MAG: hypothetical protein VX910_02030 [Candidatus Latescibacterota bacterium]|nr:hypothetical protein [Candidatus Latescibacterota bacterium]